MLASQGNPGIPPISSGGAFIKGFLLRLVYGSLALPLLVLIRPDFLGENRIALIGGCAFYLIICIAGGIYDASTRQTRILRLFERPGLGSIVGLVIILLALWLNR